MQRRRQRNWILVLAAMAVFMLAGCSEDDCPTCVEPAPVAPTEVFSVSGDGEITVYWNDYPEIYNDDLVGYRIWSRFFVNGDENNPAREFYYMDEVLVGQNYDPDTGQYHWIDAEVDNAVDYEYAVSAFTESSESYLSFEFVVDTPLPMSEEALTIHDVLGENASLAGFDFSRAGENAATDPNGESGVVDPTVPGTQADIQVRFDENDVPWLEIVGDGVRVQDYGTYLDGTGHLDFAGVSWAPEFGWSESGVLELIAGHIYVVEIFDEQGNQELHYAKLGVTGIVAGPTGDSVQVMWAYQLVDGLPELSPPGPKPGSDVQPQFIRL